MNNQQSRQQLFDTMVINQNITNGNGLIVRANIPLMVERTAGQIIANKDRYEAIAQLVNKDMPWYCVAVIHELECTQNFHCYLGNGQPINKVTTIVPKGRGPFGTFEEGAIDALKLQGFDKITDWSMGNILYILEGFNGMGYELYHHINSPYLWSGSQHYSKGKYTADGKFDSNAVSQQIGVALLLKKILENET